MKVIIGAGGFIGGHLAKSFGPIQEVRCVDKKPLSQWYQKNPFAENLVLDCSKEENCKKACEGATVVYNMAADMGGMGFIERFRIECLRSVLINTHLVEAAYQAGAQKYFFASSACVYNTFKQLVPGAMALKETDAYPAMAERGYGWEKLLSEMLCQEYYHERRFKTFIARFHNVYGPNGTWDGGREKAPAALCRKIIEAALDGKNEIDIWGDGRQTRSFMYVDDCITGIDRIINCPGLIAKPINLGSSTLISIKNLSRLIQLIDGLHLTHRYDLDAPKGVMGRNSDNSFIKFILQWEPSYPLSEGLLVTYNWIKNEIMGNRARNS